MGTGTRTQAITKAVEPTAHEQFANLHADTQERLATLAHEWAAGEWSSGTWAEQMEAILLSAHTAAVVIGRSHAGDDAPEEADDREFAIPIVAEESRYLEGFREQLSRGEYDNEDGTRDGEAVAARAQGYLGRVTGTANQAFFATLPQETLVYWECVEDESSCLDCPEMEEESPWVLWQMPLHVGMNLTECLSSCRCREHTAEGLIGFTTP